MPKYLASTELRQLLNSANKEFAVQIKKNSAVSTHYVEIATLYQRIVDIVKEEQGPTPLRKIFSLAATLGVIQCKMNSFNLSPVDKPSLAENDQQLQLLEQQLDQLVIDTLQLQEKFIAKQIIKLPKGYNTLLSQLNQTKKKWRKDTRNLQAAYYYNYADHILKIPPSVASLTTAIEYLRQSATFYAKNSMQVEKEQTDCKINETSKLLAQLQSKGLVVSLVNIRPNVPIETPVNIALPPSLAETEHSDNDTLYGDTVKRTPVQKPEVDQVYNAISYDQATSTVPASTSDPVMTEPATHVNINVTSTMSLTRDRTRDKSSNPSPILKEESGYSLPIKKRKISVITLDDEQTTQTLAVLTNSNKELLDLETSTFNEIAASLEIDSSFNANLFYASLLNNIARCILTHSDHDRFTRLRMAEIALYLSKLEEKSAIIRPCVLENERLIDTVYHEISKDHLLLLGSLKRFQPETLREKLNTEDGLKTLFLSEIKDFYFNKKIVNPDNKSRKNALNKINTIVKTSITETLTEQTIKIIANLFLNLSIASESHFYTELSSLIPKFYLLPENKKNWLEENIPIKPTHVGYGAFLSELTNFLPSSIVSTPITTFFTPPSATTLTKKDFLVRLTTHLLTIKHNYLSSITHYSTLCEHLIQFIGNQSAVFLDQRNAAHGLTSG